MTADALTVYYDDGCEFCRWCRHWLEAQPLRVPMRFVAVSSDEAVNRLGTLATGRDLVVVADDGRAWVGSSAFVVCLWATVRHADLAAALRLPVARTSARAFFHTLTANRALLARFV